MLTKECKLKMNTSRLKAFFFIIVLVLNINLLAQTKIDSLKFALKTGLEKFIDATKNSENYKYINAFFFEQLLTNINPKTTPKLYQLDTFNDISISLHINSTDSTFSYEYISWAQNESYYKNCFPKISETKYQPNLIYSSSSGAFDLASVDTISNVIITKPTQNRYEVFRSRCPGGLSKEKATKVFMNQILGQYQLVIYLNNLMPRAYFIAPPNPSSEFRLKHTSGNF